MDKVAFESLIEFAKINKFEMVLRCSRCSSRGSRGSGLTTTVTMSLYSLAKTRERGASFSASFGEAKAKEGNFESFELF